MRTPSKHWKTLQLALLFLPAAQASTGIFPVKEFGAVGDGITDDRVAIQSAIDAAIASKQPAIVRFGTNCTYRLAPSKESIASLQVSGASHLSLEGNGSLLLTHPSNRTLSIFDSSDIRVGGFKIDYDSLPYTQGRIESIESDSVIFTVDEGYPPPRTVNHLFAIHPILGFVRLSALGRDVAGAETIRRQRGFNVDTNTCLRMQFERRNKVDVVRQLAMVVDKVPLFHGFHRFVVL